MWCYGMSVPRTLLVAAQILPIFTLDCNAVKCVYGLLCHKHQQSCLKAVEK